MQCYALPNAQEVNHWQKEIAAALTKFRYKTKSEAKSDRVHQWMWAMDLPKWYNTICEDLEESNTVPYSEIEHKLKSFMGEVTNYIVNNANSKQVLKNVSVQRIKQMMKLGE